ncbi:MAG: hypothetical protein IAG10_24925 [Planctomycetaceae bacterium]|nr:hypothetical protein [Planctomycetaceae bacterium]
MTYGLGNRPHDSATVKAIRSSDKQRNSVAPKVATDIADDGCERLLSAADTDPDLAQLVSAWATLPEHIRATIRMLVESVATLSDRT